MVKDKETTIGTDISTKGRMRLSLTGVGTLHLASIEKKGKNLMGIIISRYNFENKHEFHSTDELAEINENLSIKS